MASEHQRVLEQMVEDQPERLPRKMRSAVADRERADDLAQETLLRALRSAAGLRGPADEALLCGWVDTIAANLIRNHYRDTARAPHLEQINDTDLSVAVDADPARAAESTASMAALEALIGELPGDQRTVFIRRVIDEATTRDVAEELGISEDLVRWRLHRARERLRSALDQLDIPPVPEQESPT